MSKATVNVKTKIKNLIKEKNISVYELAIQSDLTETCIRNWYSKRNYSPSIEALEKICNALNITLSQLFMKEDEKLIPATAEITSLVQDWSTLDKEEQQLILDLMKKLK